VQAQHTTPAEEDNTTMTVKCTEDKPATPASLTVTESDVELSDGDMQE
jgi:hypothetical protein